MEIGVVSAVSPAAPESIEAGRKKLNSMLEMWLSKGIVIGTNPLDQAGDDLNEPADCRTGIVTNLAIACASLFSNGKSIISPDLRSAASMGYSDIVSLYRRTDIPYKTLSSTTPKGAGNNYFGTRRTFWANGTKLEN